MSTVTSAFPTSPLEAMQLVAAAQAEAQAAFLHLFAAPSENRVRREVQRAYRDKAARLLDLLHRHNDSGLAPTRWDLTIVAQPLVQQTLIEADIVDALGEPTEAAQLREWAFDIATRELPPLALARIRRSIAAQRANDGRFNEALSDFKDVRTQFMDGGDVIQAAQTALEESALLEWLGDQERAFDALSAAHALIVSQTGAELPIGDGSTSALLREQQSIAAGRGPTGEADRAASLWRASVEILEHEARVRKARGENDAAAALWERVLPAYQSIGGGAAIEYQLAAIDRARGRFREARERLQRIEPEFATGLLAGKKAGLCLLQSYVALGLNEPVDALDLAEKGIAELETHADDDLAWRLQWRKAEALRALNRTDEALSSYADAAVAIDSLRKSPLGYRLDSTSLRNKLPLIEEAIAFAADTGHASDCLRFIELVKGRALTSALSVPPSTRTSRTALEIEFDDVTRQLDALEYNGYSGTLDGAIVRNERAELLARRIALMEQIRLRDPRWRGLSTPPPFDTARVTATLRQRNQAALTLHMHDGIVRSVLVVNGQIEVGRCTLGNSVITTLADYAANLVRPIPDPYSLDPVDLQLDAAMFVPPELLGKALASRSLVVAPHAGLHLLPWPSLPFNGKRLFEHTPVGVVPNLTCVLTLDSVPQKAPRAALAGVTTYPGLVKIEDLPFTGVELEALAAFYGTRLIAPPLIDGTATEAAVRTLAAREDAGAAILHLSCHGTLSVEEPLASGVLLRDGKIDAAEWAQLRLHYDEVVLSACSTGWRPMTAQGVTLEGDDILGLPGALLEAGARSIVVSIPKANDKVTAAFMTAYHRRRVDNSPLIAFNQTQREMLAGANEPYTWSGLVCYGVC